jgi:hypothetical protein
MTTASGNGTGVGLTVPVDILVGGVIGGVAVLSLIALGISFILIQRRRLNGLRSPSQLPATKQHPQVFTQVQNSLAHELEPYFTTLPPQNQEQQRAYGLPTPEYGSRASPVSLNQLHTLHPSIHDSASETHYPESRPQGCAADGRGPGQHEHLLVEVQRLPRGQVSAHAIELPVVQPEDLQPEDKFISSSPEQV